MCIAANTGSTSCSATAGLWWCRRAGTRGVDVVGARWSDRVRVVSCEPDAVAGLPQAVLVRPDGYVAWASDAVGDGDVSVAVSAWCGPATFAAQHM